ncbi:MAG: SDR family oxidoreductase [Polyangiaceae bacterium]|nr:SDR family oxidoreductase [Polyangiaceae bacterium]
MSNNTKVLVTGAGGTVGSSLVAELRHLRPRLAFRSADKEARAKAEGHETIRLDYGSPASLDRAMDGIDAVFLLGSGGLGQEQAECAVVSAAKSAGVRKVVKLSVWSAPEEAYEIAKIHRAIERFIERSGLAFTFLRPNGFMQNFSNHMAGSIKSGAFYQPAAEAAISHVDVRDIARAAAGALTTTRHEGKGFDLSGPEAISYARAAAVLSEVLGKDVRYVAVSDDAAKDAMISSGMPGFYADYLIDLNRHYRTGAGAAVSPAIEELTGRAPTSFQSFVEAHVHAFR